MKKTPGTFEAKLAALEEVIAKLESADVPLEEAITFYEQGMALHKECEKILSEAKLRVEKLSVPEQSDSISQ